MSNLVSHDLEKINHKIGHTLGYLRQSKHMSTQDACMLIGCSVKEYEDYENAKSHIPASKLFLILEKLGMQVSSFTSLSGMSHSPAIIKDIDQK